jgi:hypothetical protein
MSEPKLYEAFGDSQTLFDWSLDPRCSVSWQQLRQRIKYRWTMERALTQPLRKRTSEETKREIREAVATGLPVRTVAKVFGVCQSSAYVIVSGKA